jgi:hypothetical protein
LTCLFERTCDEAGVWTKADSVTAFDDFAFGALLR